MATRIPIILDTQEELNTADPQTNRPSGTLVAAPDVHHHYWGPRVGTKAYTHALESSGSAMGYDYITMTGGSATASSYNPQWRDWGTKWTLDLFFKLREYAYAGTTPIGIFEYQINSVSCLRIRILTTVADQGKIEVLVTPTGVVGGTITTTAIDPLAGSVPHVHLTVVRDGESITVYDQGVSIGTGSTSTTRGFTGTGTQTGDLTLAFNPTGTNIYFDGNIYAAVWRVGVFNTLPFENYPPSDCRDMSIRSYLLGADLSYGANAHSYWDLGPYQHHALLSGTSGVQFTTTAGPDNRNYFAPVQGFGTATTRDGKVMTTVIVGGYVYRSYL